MTRRIYRFILTRMALTESVRIAERERAIDLAWRTYPKGPHATIGDRLNFKNEMREALR